MNSLLAHPALIAHRSMPDPDLATMQAALFGAPLHQTGCHDAVQLRLATMADVPALNALIDLSVRRLSVGFYTAAQIDAALDGVFGVDSQLITDGTYYIIDGERGPVAAGGWSGRRTLYGGDHAKGGDDAPLDASAEPARIRALYVHPDHARRGLARQLYAECERAARAAGFRRFELMATAPGEPLYVALGFVVVERHTLSLANGVEVPFARMARSITETSGYSALPGRLVG